MVPRIPDIDLISVMLAELRGKSIIAKEPHPGHSPIFAALLYFF
jgi:hypothetical protein